MSQSSDRDNFPGLGSQEGVEPQTLAHRTPRQIPNTFQQTSLVSGQFLIRLDALVLEFADIHRRFPYVVARIYQC